MELAPTEETEMEKLKEMVRGIVWCAVALYAVTFIRETEGGAA